MPLHTVVHRVMAWGGKDQHAQCLVLAELNMDNACHLEHLTWAVYDGALLVGSRPKIPGNCPWCMVLAGLYKHIYRGHDDAAHCLLHMLGSWDCQERIEVLCRGGRLSSMRSGQRRASRPRRRSRSSSQHHSQTPAQGNRDGCSHGSSLCMPSRCHCGAAISPNANTMPKLASAVNVPSHAWCSHSSGEMAWASLYDEDTWDDDFQTPNTPVCHIVRREDAGHGEPVDGKMEASRRSPSWQTCYQVDIGEEETMLKTINPTWRTTCWLQLVVQSISDDEVPWYELVLPLMVRTEGAALSLAKCFLMVWRWSVKVLGREHLPSHPDCSQHHTIHDQGGSVGGHRQATLVCSLLPHPAAGW